MNFSIEQSKNFIKNHARPVDLALFEYEFKDRNPARILEELSKYQNQDGGFGYGIEPDLKTKSSSAIATITALEYLTHLDDDITKEMVRKAVNYLLYIYFDDYGYWPVTNEDVNHEPHAWWWEYGKSEKNNGDNPDDLSGKTFGYMHKMAISGHIVGYLNKYSELIDSEKLAEINRKTKNRIQEKGLFDDSDILYTFLEWNKGYKYMPNDLKDLMKPKFKFALEKYFAESGDLEEKNGFWLAPTPDSIFNKLFPDLTKKLYEEDVKSISEDGGIWPRWEWKTNYPEDWEIARVEWAGKLTTEYLIALKHFNYIQ